jgi:hypothetical protein
VLDFKSIIRSALYSRGFLLEKTAEPASVAEFIRRFQSQMTPVDLIRIGGSGDGGYLVPNDLEGIKHCFSPGVDYTANFENELVDRYGMKCFMADASVEAPPIANPGFDFEPVFLGARNDEGFTTLSSWMEEKVPADDKDMLLQMDIEGFEYDVLIETELEALRRFRIMVFEFHDMEKLFNESFQRVIRSVFEKLYKAFSIVHVHGNNCCGLVHYDDISVPKLLEITFLRRDRLEGCAVDGPIVLPHALDEKNVAAKDDILMPEMWWK